MKNFIFIQDEKKKKSNIDYPDIKIYTHKFELVGKLVYIPDIKLWVLHLIQFLTLCRLNEVASYMKRLNKEKIGKNKK